MHLIFSLEIVLDVEALQGKLHCALSKKKSTMASYNDGGGGCHLYNLSLTLK
jgi:hypothetical protein